MADIRPKVLKFAKDAVGTRVWTQVHRRNAVRTKLLGLVSTFTYQNQSIVCKKIPEQWKTDTVHILSDNRTSNDFTGRDKAVRKGCDIGVGECWDLAYAALDAHNGITRVSSYVGSGRKWSNTLLSGLSGVTGGEILEIKTTTYFLKMSYTRSGDNIISYGASSWSKVGPSIPHTAVIKNANAVKGLVNVYEQNTVSAGVRNLLVHEGKYFLVNRQFVENGETFVQLCGGNAVKNFTSRLITIQNLNFRQNSTKRKLKKLVEDIETYVNSHSSIFSNVKIYVPKSP